MEVVSRMIEVRLEYASFKTPSVLVRIKLKKGQRSPEVRLVSDLPCDRVRI